jgi:hypothetical protein
VRAGQRASVVQEAVAIVLLILVMIGSAVAQETEASSIAANPRTEVGASPAGREAAHEARLRLYENELLRLAQEGARAPSPSFEPSQLVGAIAISSMLTTLLTLLTLRALESLGLWRGRSARARKDLEALEKRVMTGLREFDALLTQLMGQAKDELRREPTQDASPFSLADDRLGMDTAKPVRRPSSVAPRAAASPAATRRKEIVALARQGLGVEEIGRRVRLGPGEVKLILKLAGTR